MCLLFRKKPHNIHVLLLLSKGLKMKLLSLLLLSFSLLTNTSITYADNTETGFDTTKYSIEDEVEFSVIMYDYSNALLLDIMGVESTTVDRGGQIERIRQANPIFVMEAESKLSVFLANMNMLKLKEETIKEFNKQNIDIFKRNFTPEQAHEPMRHIYREENRVLKSTPNISFVDAIIYRYIFKPLVDKSIFDQSLPLPMINSAISVAVSRVNPQYWHKQIYDCGIKKENTGSLGIDPENIHECSEPYFEAITNSAQKIITQMGPVRHIYNQMRHLPDDSKMEKKYSKDGKTYMWVEKE